LAVNLQLWERAAMQIRKHTDVIRALLPLKGKRVLDVGCGDGALTRFLAREGATVTGIDISTETLARARAAEKVSGADYAEGRGETLPYPDASIDGVVYMNSLHHVPINVQAQAVAEAARVLKPGGLLLAIEPLAEGANFALVRIVEDESEVRKAAYQALRMAPPSLLRHGSEEFYDAPIRYDDFAAFEARTRAVDPARGPRLEQHREKLVQDFARLGRRQDDGVWFEQPTRANVLAKLA
jgi:ubiquinone/menaquinone biosynthesis C-methylase UbiE